MVNTAIMLLSIPLISGGIYITYRKLNKFENILNLIGSVLGGTLLVLFAFWSLHIKDLQNRALIVSFVMFLSSMWALGVISQLTEKKLKLQAVEVILSVAYIPAFLIIDSTWMSMLGSALSVSIFLFFAGVMDILQPAFKSKNMGILKGVFWIWFFILGIIFTQALKP